MADKMKPGPATPVRAFSHDYEWKGKDEQVGQDREVPAVPICIHGTVDPLALVEDLRASATP